MTDKRTPSLAARKRVGLGDAHFERGLRTALAGPSAVFFAGVLLLWAHSFEPRSTGQGLVGLAVALAGAVELVVAPIAFYRLWKHGDLRTPPNLTAAGAGSAVVAAVMSFLVAMMTHR